jgi:uncharacterized protein DUF2877
VPHASGASDASTAEKRVGGDPWGASGVRQWRATKDSTGSSREASGTAQPATTSVHASQARDRMPTTIAGRYNAAVRMGTVVGIGGRAATVLRESGGAAQVLAPLSASIYIVVRGQVLWLGGPDDTLHPRAILLSESPVTRQLAGDTVRVPSAAVPPWRPAPPPADARAITSIRRGAAQLTRVVASLGRPEGFGARLEGAALAFPLAGVAERADALASACAADQPDRAAVAAMALLGLGPGLTPSGDDFVGGAFFARALLGGAGACKAETWRQAAGAVREAAERSTHPISAALLGDLLEGQGWAPLHDLVQALACGDEAASTDAARRLTQLGHSSGWDILAGFVAGAALTAPLVH